MSDNRDAVVAFTNMKAAALYFSYVIPEVSYLVESAIATAIDRSQQEKDWQDEVIRELTNELPPHADLARLLPPDMKEDKTFMRLLTVVPIWGVVNDFVHQGLKHGQLSDRDGVLGKLADVGKKAMRVNLLHSQSLDVSYDVLMSRYGLDEMPAIMPPEFLTLNAVIESVVEELIIEGKLKGTQEPREEQSPDCRVTLANANLIDTSTATWEQILDFREDTVSQEKLQKLRRFLTTNYEGKGRAFIEDDLHLRLEDHDAVVRKFGFDTKTMVLEAIFTSKWLQASAAGVGFAVLLGQPLTAIASGFTGILFEVGNASVKLMKRKFELEQSVEQHPLGYVISAKERLEDSSS